MHAHRMLPHIHYLIHQQSIGHLVDDKDHRHLSFQAIDRLRKMLDGLLIELGNDLIKNQ